MTVLAAIGILILLASYLIEAFKPEIFRKNLTIFGILKIIAGILIIISIIWWLK